VSFGSPPFRSLLLRPTTSTPPIVRNYFAILTHTIHIPNTSIYMFFRVAQDHKAAGRDTTLSTPSSTRREDPAATMWRRSHSLLSLAIVSVLVSRVMNYIVVELVLLVVNYIVDLMICVWCCYCVKYCCCDIAHYIDEMLYSLPVLEHYKKSFNPWRIFGDVYWKRHNLGNICDDFLNFVMDLQMDHTTTSSGPDFVTNLETVTDC
jgi:hypothetical protein